MSSLLVTLNDDANGGSSKIPSYLRRRPMQEEYSIKRYLENEEIVLVALLDNEGKISDSTKLADFMLLLTRVEEKVCCPFNFVRYVTVLTLSSL
jgi:hypothetical protein